MYCQWISTLLLISLWFLSSSVQGQLLFPLTFGGFTKDTAIEKVYLDDSENILIAGYSQDLQLVSTAGDKFIVFLERDASSYKWSTKFPVAQIPGDLTKISMKSDSSRAALLYFKDYNRQDLVILNMNDGSVIRRLSHIS